MISNHLIQEKHTFCQEYEDSSGNKQKTCVYLEVDHRSKEFKILPGDGRSEFGFVNGSHKLGMWQATVKCIQAALDYAITVLNGATNPTVVKRKAAVSATVASKSSVDHKMFAKLPRRARRAIIDTASKKLGKTIKSNEELSLELLASLSYKNISNVRYVGVDTMRHVVLFFQNHGLNIK